MNKPVYEPRMSPEEFYNDKNSVYVRLTYIKETDSYTVMMNNEIDLENADENAIKIALICRGLLELVKQEPSAVFEIGYKAAIKDQAMDELINNPKGNA